MRVSMRLFLTLGIVLALFAAGCSAPARRSAGPVGPRAAGPGAPAAANIVKDVPDVTGLSLADARDKLGRLGYSVAFFGVSGQVETTSDPAAGTVVNQYPLEGRPLSPGAAVKLGVAVPEGMVLVPDIEGLPDAEKILLSAGLTPTEEVVKGSVDSDAAGFMMPYRQSPRPGVLVPRGSKVTYRIWLESS